LESETLCDGFLRQSFPLENYHHQRATAALMIMHDAFFICFITTVSGGKATKCFSCNALFQHDAAFMGN